MQNLPIFPDQASSTAVAVDHLVLYALALSVFFSVLIFGCIGWFAIRYRRRSPDEIPAKVPSSTALEIAWTLIPLALLLVMFVWGTKVYSDALRPPPDAMEIFVIGKQWMWKIQHPEGRREINTLHVPLGRAVRLTLTSQDVIHDFAVPAFRMKQDVRPGSYSTEWFIPTKLGTYHLFCDQYCGAKHAEMIGSVIVMEPQEYARWLAGDSGNVPPRNEGERLFTYYGCITCHGTYAPTLAGLYGSPVEVVDEHGNRRTVIADEEYLRESILYPANQLVVGYPNRMPSFKGSISEEQLVDLIEYIKSLSGSAAIAPHAGTGEGATTQPNDFEPRITNPPFSSHRANQ